MTDATLIHTVSWNFQKFSHKECQRILQKISELASKLKQIRNLQVLSEHFTKCKFIAGNV